MSDAARFVRPEIRKESLYTLAEPPHRVKIDQNENPFDLEADVKREVLAKAERLAWCRYPEFHQQEVTAALAAKEGWPAEGILVGNGSNELLLATLLAVGGAGRTGVVVSPAFSLYAKMLRMTGTGVETVPLARPGWSYDPAALAAALAGEGGRFGLFALPNNPTGTNLSLADIRPLAETGRLLLLDAAYGEFAPESLRPLLDEFPNVVLFRTFSKARRLAALRFGYLLAAPSLAAEIRKTKLPYNVNAITTAAVVTLLERERRDGPDPTVALLVRERERLAGLLSGAGLPVVASQANFLLVEPGIARRGALFEALLASGILVRDFSSSPGLEGTLRISIGAPIENDAVADTVRRFLAAERP